MSGSRSASGRPGAEASLSPRPAVLRFHATQVMLRSLFAMLSPLLADPTARDDHARRFERFLREQRAELVGFLRSRTRTEEDAQDAAQESLVKLLRYRDTQPPENWKALLYRIATNVACDQARHGQRRHAGSHVPLEDVEFVLSANGTPVEERSIQHQELARIGAVIDTLPTRRREIYLLSRVEGMTNAEIAHHCGISIKAVEKHMTLAMAAVRQGLGHSDREAF